MPAIRFGSLDYAAALAFTAYSASAVITPICLVILAEELGFSLSEGGGIEAMRGVLIVVALIGSGFASAHFGKAVSLGASLILLGIGLFLYSAAPGYAVVVLAAGLLGVGGGVVEGLLNPLVQDQHPHDSGRYLNIINGFWSIGVLVTVLISGELLTHAISWRWLMGGLGALSIGAGAIFLMLIRHAAKPAELGTVDVLRHKWEVLASGRFWLFAALMVVAGAAEGAFTFWTASYIQINHQGTPRAAGIGTAIFAGGMMVGRFAFGWFVPQSRLRLLILLSAIGGAGVSIIFPFIESLNQLYILLALAGVAIACFWPSLQSYAADRMPVDTTALFILMSCAGIPGFAFISWTMGIIADHTDLRTSFFAAPICLVILIGLILIEAAWKPVKGDQMRGG
jgi:fucose permease